MLYVLYIFDFLYYKRCEREESATERQIKTKAGLLNWKSIYNIFMDII